jgi:hypothetical protein
MLTVGLTPFIPVKIDSCPLVKVAVVAVTEPPKGAYFFHPLVI